MVAAPGYWSAMALAISLAMLAIAHAFETFGHMAPCELCLKERQVYWIAAAVAAGAVAVGALRLGPNSRNARRLGNLALGLVFLAGTALAAYHAGVEWKFWPGPASCTGGSVHVSAADLSRLLNGGPVAAPACDKPAWIFFGLSMAGWNAIISLGLVGLSVLAVQADRPESRPS